MGRPHFIKGNIMPKPKGKSKAPASPVLDMPVPPSTTSKEEDPKVVKPRVVTVKRAAGAAFSGNADTMYSSAGGKAYNPRATHNAEAWDKVQKVLGAGQKAKYVDLCKVLEEHFKYSEENHYNFLGYMVRRGSLHIL